MALPKPPIQIRPPGLLSLLGIQNGGRTPETLGETTQPTFDLADWYLRAAQVVRSTTGVTVIDGGNSNAYKQLRFNDGANEILAVPQDEWWYIHNWSHAVVTGAGTTISNMKFVAIYDPAALTRRTIPGDVQAPYIQVAASRFEIGCGGFWLPPGTQLQLGFGIIVFAGANSDLGTLVYTPVKV